MKKQIVLTCKEKIRTEKFMKAHGISNGFGKIIDLPSTPDIRIFEEDFDAKELGDLFIQFGEELKRETDNISNIEINTTIKPNPTDRGKLLQVVLEYETKK